MLMINVDTSSLTGERLDYAVAVAVDACKQDYKHFLSEYLSGKWNYSTCWNKTGPMIERFMVKVFVVDDSSPNIWRAEISDPFKSKKSVFSCIGSCPKEAALRCIVASISGWSVKVPSELENKKSFY